MSIQVLSSALLNAPQNPAATGPDGLVADTAGSFADLLAQQLIAPAMIALDAQGKATADPKSDAKLLEEASQPAGEDAALLGSALPWLAQTTNLPLRPVASDKQEGKDKLAGQLADMIGTKISATSPQAEGADQAAPLRAGVEIGANRTALPAAATDSLANRPGNVSTVFANEMGQASERLAANFADSNTETPLNLPQLPSTHASAQAAKELATPISTGLHDNRWATDFGQKVVWMARAEQQNAQININPPQLGPIQISINLNGDNATASFASPHAEVRQALETALPRLREMLADAGINLGQANVGSQFAQQQNPQENRQAASDSPRIAVDNAILSGQSGAATGNTVLPSRGQGLVDLFA